MEVAGNQQLPELLVEGAQVGHKAEAGGVRWGGVGWDAVGEAQGQ